jgi:hypothetical protein
MGRVGRFVLVTVLAGGLLSGVSAGVASAGSDAEYSESDCEIMSNLQVEGDQSGYYGKTALAASKVFGDAADELEDEDLAGAMTTLSKTWGKAGRAKGAIGAAKVLGRSGKKYYDALELYTKALVTCSLQPFDDDTTSTTDSDDD